MHQNDLLNIIVLSCALSLIGCGDDAHTETSSNPGTASENAAPQAESVAGGGEIAPSTDGETGQVDDSAQTGLGETSDESALDPEDTESDMESAVPDIAEILEGDPRFSEVLELVNIIGLLDAMRGPGPFTVFVPVNDAVLSLPDSTMERVRGETAFLHQFILAHVAEGDHSADSLLDRNAIEMIGGEVEIELMSDGDVRIGGADVLEADIQARNGRVHALGQVIPVPSDSAHGDGSE